MKIKQAKDKTCKIQHPGRDSSPFGCNRPFCLSDHSLFVAVGSDASNIRARASDRYQPSHIPDPPRAVDAGKTSALIIDKTGEVTCPIYRCGLVNFWAVGRKKRPAASGFADICREVFVEYPLMQYMKPIWFLRSKILKSCPCFVYFCAELACRAFPSTRSENIVPAAFHSFRRTSEKLHGYAFCWTTWILMPAPTSIDLELVTMIEAEVEKRRTTVMLSCVL